MEKGRTDKRTKDLPANNPYYQNKYSTAALIHDLLFRESKSCNPLPSFFSPSVFLEKRKTREEKREETKKRREE